jgi:hypothetical protein
VCGDNVCDRIIAPRQPQMAHAIGFRSRELSPKNLVFGTVLRAVFSASAMGFCVVCSMRLWHELRLFFIPAPARVFPCRLTFIEVVGQHLTCADPE